MEEFGSKYDEKVQEWVKVLSDKLEGQKDGSAGEVITSTGNYCTITEINVCMLYRSRYTHSTIYWGQR